MILKYFFEMFQEISLTFFVIANIFLSGTWQDARSSIDMSSPDIGQIWAQFYKAVQQKIMLSKFVC